MSHRQEPGKTQEILTSWLLDVAMGEREMHNSLHFTSFDPLRDAPELCGLCKARAPVFHFEFNTDTDPKGPVSRKGFCCEACAARLLTKLERTEFLEWTEEEAALADADLDTDEFHKRLESLRGVVGTK